MLSFLHKGQNHSYATDLLDSRLSCACCAAIHMVFDDPCDIEERANSLSEVGYEEGNEVYRNACANEGRLVRRAPTPDGGLLKKTDTARRVSQARSTPTSRMKRDILRG
jgi:hypothetical protein